jgi:lambda repressor-like predicted transcriptional regulator
MSPKWKLPPDAVARWQSGESLGCLAQAYGTSRTTLARALKEAGGEPAAPWALPADAASRYQAGETLAELAAEYGTSNQTLGRRLQAAGVELRSRAKTDRHRARLSAAKSTPIDEALLREMAAQGMSCLEMAPELGVSEEVVRERMVRLGIPRLPAKARPERNYFWNGGRTVDKAGYILVKAPDHPNVNHQGYVREHRLVMEQQLGRYLEPGEVVDHIDGNTSNNDPSNLRLFASNAEHLRVTLAGRVPNWTGDGRRRIQEGVRRRWSGRDATQKASGTGDPQSP